MNILHVIASLNPEQGGPMQGLRNYIPSFEKKGIHNEVLGLDDPASSFLKQDQFIIHSLGPAQNIWRYSGIMKGWLIAHIERFDVIIVHGLWLYHGYAVNKAIQRIKKCISPGKKKIPRLFVMPHGMLDPYFQKTAGRKLKALRNNIYWKYIESQLVNDADGLLFTCEEELLLARHTFKRYKPKGEFNVGFGIATPPVFKEEMRNAFLRRCNGLDGRPYILFLSRIHEKKGIDLLFEAYAILYHHPANAQLQLPLLVIAGPGVDTTFGERMVKVVKDLKIQHMVFFTGMLSGDSKWGAYYGAEIFILPSHQENFGIVVAEALACGKPVLVTNKVNIWREIKKHQAGFVNNDTVAGVYKLLSEWLTLSISEKADKSIHALNCFKNCFDVERVVDTYLETIKQL